MHPEKHLEEKIFSRKKDSFYGSSALIVSFLGSYLFLGPVIHELFHVIVLWLESCSFRLSFSFDILKGLRGAVKPFCGLGSVQEFVFFIGGYTVSFVAGLILFLEAWLFEKGFRRKAVFSVSTGIFVSVISDLSLRSDLVRGFDALKLNELLPVYFAVLVALLFGLSFLSVEILSEREEAD